MNIKDKAEYIANNAISFTNRDTMCVNEFPMYSYDKIARLVIQGMVSSMLSQGCTEEQAIKALQSKDVRWMLDKYGTKISLFGEALAVCYGLAEAAKKGY